MTAPDGREKAGSAAATAHSHAQATITSPRPGVEVILPYQQQMANRRSEPREDCNSHCMLILMPSGAQFPCRIVNQSASGAQIMFEELPHGVHDLWLIDSHAHTARFGTPAWNLPFKMGIRFSLIQKLDPAGARPQRVPEAVWLAWRKLANLDPVPEAVEDTFFLD
ncbi:MAG: hypothetical protein QM667_07475 [Asticcacaulis sp.]